MAHPDRGSRPRLRLRLPAAALGGRAAAVATLAAVLLACTSAQEAGRPPTPTSRPAPSSTAPTEANGSSCAEPCRGEPSTAGSFPVQRAPEASGLVASRRHPGVLYVLDDGPGTTGVLGITVRRARVRGQITVSGLEGLDTEALGAGPCSPRGGHCIYVGDIGDNTGQRESITIHRFREPRRLAGATAVDAEQVSLRYPDGARDAEALIVDDTGTMGIITKAPGRRGRGAARLYTASRFADGTLTSQGRVRVPAPQFPFVATVLGNVVTGADWAPGRVLLRTYDTVFEYRAEDTSNGLVGFPRWPVTEIDVASEQQGEAVAYGPDSCSVFTVSEGSGDLSVAPCKN